MNNFRDCLLGDIDSEISLGRSLVDIVDASEAGDLSASCLSIQAPPVGLLAVLDGSVDVDEEEVGPSATVGQDKVLCSVS